MKTYIKQMLVLFLAALACLFLLDAHAGKPIKVEVVAAVPDEAIQGDSLPVRIIGTGFDPGSTVRFIVTDTRDDTQIEVGTVIYDAGTGDLVAQVKVKDQALVVGYDVEVKTSSGRRGKGTTLFRVREKVGESDPCLTSTSPFPAFMFWRNTNTPNNPQFTIYLASEDGVCVRELVDVPDSTNAWNWNWSFGYNQATQHGLAVWTSGDWEDNESEIWLQEFTVGVDGNTINPPPDPERIMVTDDSNTDGLITYARDLDISDDLQYLAFVFEQVEQPYGYQETQPSETHVIDIASCRSPYTPCIPSEDSLVLKEGEGSVPNDTSHGGWGWIAWGPLDKRIYIQFRRDPVPVDQWGIHMITLTEGLWTGDKTIQDRDLFTDDDYPEYSGVIRISSGISGGREKLAFRHYGDCRTISVIDVADCEAGPTETNPRPCEAEAQFFGTQPSWTDRGTIIHEIVERGKWNKKHGYTCTNTGFIGEWDPNTLGVIPLVEGEDPDAG